MRQRMPDDFDVLVTAKQAWPAFERAVLAAQTEILGSFRIFDFSTKLRSPEALAIGQDWFDLITHVLKHGVRVQLTVSDFDPVMATELHGRTWTTVRQAAAVAEVAGARPGQFSLRPVLHPAKAGGVPWAVFLPAVIRRKLRVQADLSTAEKDRKAVRVNRAGLPQMHPVTHHQKLAVIDGQTLYVGGLDLNERRFDDQDHRRAPEDTWSDVQVILRGPEAAQARTHLREFQAVCHGRHPPTDLPQIKRTLSAPRRFQWPFLSPRTVLREIEVAHLQAFATARSLVYIETQYLRSSVIAGALADAGRRNGSLTAVVILPVLPESVAFENSEGLDARHGMGLQKKAVAQLMSAFGKRITFASPVQPVLADRDSATTRAGSPLIYVHNKVLLCDTDYALIGSANLNGRSMRWDTEVAVEITDSARLAHCRQALFRHWWHAPLPPEAMQPETLQPWWDNEIRKNAVRRPEARSGFLVPYDINNHADLAQVIPGVTEDIV